MRHKNILAAAILLMCASGCLIEHSSQYSRSGHYVADTTLQQMKPGETTTEWACVIVGDPTSIRQLADGREIWQWSYSETKTNAGAVFLLLRTNDVTKEEGTVFAEFKDGVLLKWWKG